MRMERQSKSGRADRRTNRIIWIFERIFCPLKSGQVPLLALNKFSFMGWASGGDLELRVAENLAWTWNPDEALHAWASRLNGNLDLRCSSQGKPNRTPYQTLLGHKPQNHLTAYPVLTR
jgi:hypothetical protein